MNVSKKIGRGGTDNGKFIGAHDIGIDNKDNVYVVDRENNRVQVFDSEGNWMNSFVNDSNNNYFDQPRGISIYENIMYVTNGGIHHNVITFDLTKNVKIYEFGSYCNTDNISEYTEIEGNKIGQMQFEEPHDIMINKKGEIFVTDGFNHRVQVFSIS